MIMKQKYYMTKEENIFVAKRNIVDCIWKLARLADIDVSYPDVDSIVYGGRAPGIMVDDIIAVNNMKHAWWYILDNVDEQMNIAHICSLHDVIDGMLRNTVVSDENQVKQEISDVLAIENTTDRAITLMLYLMRKQLFIDGNKRTSMLAGNQVMISNGCGIISVPIECQREFKKLLVQFYESGNMDEIKAFVYENCIDGIDFMQQNERQHVKDIEKIVQEVDASMTLEGLPLTEEDKERIRVCLNNPSLFDKIIKELIEKHTVSNTKSLKFD